MKKLLLILSFLIPFSLHAQGDPTVVRYNKRYLDLNIKSLDKYSKQIDRQQEMLLRKLRRKEEKFARQLQRKDSAGYARLRMEPLSFDSISKLNQPGSKDLSKRRNPTIDSLRGVQKFLQSQSGDAASYDLPLEQLSGKLNQQQNINSLIEQRKNQLKSIASGSKASLPAIAGIEEQIYYGKSKMKVFKDISQEPSKAEEKALEYLQGTEGFEKALGHNSNPNSMANAASAADLEKMGFQTKKQVSEQLQQQFGNNLRGVQEQMAGQVKDWQNSLDKTGQIKQVTSNVKAAKEQLKSAKTDVAKTKQSLNQVRNTDKPSFKINPMRGLPFRKRIEKAYSFQAAKASPDGTRPAIMEMAAMAGFKHTPRLSYGIGASLSTGLGQNWSNIRFTFEGVGLRTYAAWQWQYGIGAYAGYERLFKQQAFQQPGESTVPFPSANEHNNSSYSESILLGLTKSYKINSRWNGAIQLFYDIWWKDKNLNSPIILRFATNTI